ncbi:uncharacterized protein [Manis javanica]|uniref:uncharacterized protein n=1 Tax=Manis javanica TaxID=9974 RepID=UPI003C6D7539
MMVPTMRYHLTPVRIATIQKTNNNKCWRGCEERRTRLLCCLECCEDEKRSEENLVFYLKTCRECEQTGVKKLMEPDQDPLGRSERWASQDLKVTGALLDHQEGLGCRALEDTREKKETKKGLPSGGVATQPPSVRRGLRPGDGGGPSWTRRRPAGDSEPQQRGCEDEKRSEENPVFYLKTCRECEQTGVKKEPRAARCGEHRS